MKNSGIKYLVLLEIFSPDPYSDHEPLLSEDERTQAYEKYKKGLSWKEVFSEVKDENTKVKLTELLEYIDEEGD